MAAAARLSLGLAAIALVAAPAPASHGFDELAAPIKGMLMKASDRALDKLAEPGAFSADEAIRIVFPERPEQADAVIKLAHDAGAIDSLQRTINDAAGQAAAQAKPVFRMAISRITLKDTIKILSHDDGATHYLWKTAGPQLRFRLHEIIRDTLARSGAFAKLGRLKASGLLDKLPQMTRATREEDFAPPDQPDGGYREDRPRDGDDLRASPPARPADFSPEALTDSVTDQAISAIFKYIAHQERKLRKDPSVLAPVLMKALDRD